MTRMGAAAAASAAVAGIHMDDSIVGLAVRSAAGVVGPSGRHRPSRHDVAGRLAL